MACKLSFRYRDLLKSHGELKFFKTEPCFLPKRLERKTSKISIQYENLLVIVSEIKNVDVFLARNL